MSDGPWIKFYPSDWLTGTRGMSAAEIGVYITMIAMMYEKSGALVSDKAKLARACGIPAASFNKILDRLIDDGKVELDGAILTNDRVRKELHEREMASVRASERANARWGKDKENQSDDDAEALLQPSSRGARQKSEVREEENDRYKQVDNSLGSPSPKAKIERGSRLPTDWMLPRSWGEWAMAEFPHLSVDDVRRLADDFRDYWIGVPGAKGRKLDWLATWRNSVRMKAPRATARASPATRPTKMEVLKDRLRQRIANEQRTDGQGSDDLLDAGRLPLLAGPDQRRND